MSRAEIWTQFACAFLTGSAFGGTKEAAERADEMMKEFEKRFRWQSQVDRKFGAFVNK